MPIRYHLQNWKQTKHKPMLAVNFSVTNVLVLSIQGSKLFYMYSHQKYFSTTPFFSPYYGTCRLAERVVYVYYFHSTLYTTGSFPPPPVMPGLLSFLFISSCVEHKVYTSTVSTKGKGSGAHIRNCDGLQAFSQVAQTKAPPASFHASPQSIASSI